MNHETDNQKILGNCPTCQRLMQIPLVTDVASVAKCPHCENTIRVRDLLASAVPEAEIIVGDKDNAKPVETDYVADRQRVYDESRPKNREKFEVPNQLYNGASRRNRKRRGKSRGASSHRSSSRHRSEGSAGASNGKAVDAYNVTSPSNGTGARVERTSLSQHRSNPPSSATGKGAATANGAAAVKGSSSNGKAVQERPKPKTKPKPTPRPRSSSRGNRSRELEDEVDFGLSDVLKFLGGGLIAAPLAYLALLWVLGVDPFGLASTFESVSPSLVPQAMRSDGLNDQPRSGFAPPAGDSSSELFGAGADEDSSEGDFEDGSLPLPSLDPDLVR